MATTAEQIRKYDGPALFERGFRPFFLGAALLAGLTLPLWLSQYALGWDIPSHLTARDFHIHEMIFGYLGAALAGFLLTAVPNWTGRLPVAGTRLMFLSGLWLAGRLAMFFGMLSPVSAAILDSLFLLSLAALVWREVISGGNTRNIPICVLISLMSVANIAYHILYLSGGETGWAERSALAISVMLISLIGGRVVPSFTRNWMAQRQMAPLPVPFSNYDKIILVVSLIGLSVWIVLPYDIATAVLFSLLAALHFFRLLRWRGWMTAGEAIVFILHVGYLWLPIWFALTALAFFAPDIVNAADTVHALTAGAIGTMTLAIMTRASLGHSGRNIEATSATKAIYLLVVAGAVLRVIGPYLPIDQIGTFILSGILWSGAFWLFVAVYGTIFFTPRKN